MISQHNRLSHANGSLISQVSKILRVDLHGGVDGLWRSTLWGSALLLRRGLTTEVINKHLGILYLFKLSYSNGKGRSQRASAKSEIRFCSYQSRSLQYNEQ